MFNAQEIDVRLRRKLTLPEFGAIVFVFLLAVFFVFSETGSFYDYHNYMAGAQGDLSNYFYGYWLLPFLYPISMLPYKIGLLFWIILNLFGVWIASRIFNGRTTFVLLAYQTSYLLFWGQITGIICGAIGLFWWALNKHKPYLAGLPLLIAISKPQSGFVFAALLWLFADIPWKEKIQSLVIPMIGVVLTFSIYPNWLTDILKRNMNVIDFGNISLWQWVGLWGTILIVIAILLPLKKQKRFFAISSAVVLAIPYFLQTELLTFFIFPIGIVPILLGYLPGIFLQLFSFPGQKIGVIVLLTIFLSNVIPELTRYSRGNSFNRSKSEERKSYE